MALKTLLMALKILLCRFFSKMIRNALTAPEIRKLTGMYYVIGYYVMGIYYVAVVLGT